MLWKMAISALMLVLATTTNIAANPEKVSVPDLSKFETSSTCKGEFSPIPNPSVEVKLYLLHRNERSPYNEIVYLITVTNTQTQFMFRGIIEGADDPGDKYENVKERAEAYIKTGP